MLKTIHSILLRGEALALHYAKKSSMHIRVKYLPKALMVQAVLLHLSYQYSRRADDG